MTELTLYDYQDKAIDNLRTMVSRGFLRTLVCLATGAGKTETAAKIAQYAKSKGKTVHFLVDRNVLVHQTSARFDKYGIDHGTIAATHWRTRPMEKIQIVSIQTAESRGLPQADILLWDEAHCNREFVNEYLKQYPKTVVIGLSASPFTKGIAARFDGVICPITMDELIANGKLVAPRVFTGKVADMTGAKTTGGEWTDAECARRGTEIIGDIVSNWIKHTGEIFDKPPKTIVFASTVIHAQEICAAFRDAGYEFAALTYKEDSEQKEELIARFNDPQSDLLGLVSISALERGFDSPVVSCIVLARPLRKSFSSHIQQVGRGLRAFPGKEFCLVLDHTENFLRFLDDWRTLSAEGINTLHGKEEVVKKTDIAKVKSQHSCPRCHMVWQTPPPNDTCPGCGYKREKRISQVVSLPGQLEELIINAKYQLEHEQKWYSELLGYASQKSYAQGWAYHKFLKKFNNKNPNHLKRVAKPPTSEVINWITHINIRYHRAAAKWQNRRV